MEIQNTVEPIRLKDIDISPYNVRQDFNPNDEAIAELAKSIDEFGQLQPVVLVGKKPQYKLIVGQRRYFAIKKLGWAEIRAIFLEDDNWDSIKATIVSLSENLHREQLTYEDMQNAITRLFDHYQNAKAVAKALGCSVQTVYEYLRVEKFNTTKIKKWIKEKKASKEDLKRAIVIAKGNKDDVEEILSKLIGMTRYEKNRAINARREKPDESNKKIIDSARESKTSDILTLNLSTEMEIALDKAKSELREERETIAINALRIWLVENRFL